MALAAAKFVEGLLKALSGENVVQCAYVQSDVVPGLEYFSTPIMIGVSSLLSQKYWFILLIHILICLSYLIFDNSSPVTVTILLIKVKCTH